MSRTAERLRDVATAVGATVTEQDLPELQLGEQRQSRRRWSGGRWLIPVVAAIAVLVAIDAARVLDQYLALRSAPGADIPHRTSIAPVKGTPKYLVTAQSGHGSVRLAATGATIAEIPSPVKNYRVEGVAAAPGNQIFYLAGRVDGAHASRLLFFRVTLRSDGQPLPARLVPGPPAQMPFPIVFNWFTNIPLAVSPDGTQLAYSIPYQALGKPGTTPAKIVVLRVATGATRTWEVGSHGSEVSELSWAVGGQLSYVATIDHSTVRGGRIVRDSYRDLCVLALFSTQRPAGNVLAASRLVIYRSQSNDGTTLDNAVQAGVITADGSTAIAEILTRQGTAKLVEVSVASGKITRVLLSGGQAVQSDPEAIDGDNLLITLPRGVAPTDPGSCGHLALAKLGTGRITSLPVPVFCSIDVPDDPLFAAW